MEEDLQSNDRGGRRLMHNGSLKKKNQSRRNLGSASPPGDLKRQRNKKKGTNRRGRNLLRVEGFVRMRMKKGDKTNPFQVGPTSRGGTHRAKYPPSLVREKERRGRVLRN